MIKVALASGDSAQRRRMWLTTYLSVSGKALDDAFVPVDLLEDDQTLPSLTIVVRSLLMVALKEQSLKGEIAGRLEPYENNTAKK